MQTVLIIDYGSGNIRSAAKALERAALERGLDVRVRVDATPEAVHSADRLVLPGVGAFGDCKAGIDAVEDLEAALVDRVRMNGVPFLGICVGMQLMAKEGLEHGTHAGFGWLDGSVKPLTVPDASFKIPHMGWNRLTFDAPDHPILKGVQNGDHAYFVHSYAMQTARPDAVVAHTDYGGQVTAIVQSETAIGTQFHPEKSQAVGLALLGNFLEWQP